MITVGLVPSQQLVSLLTDDEGNYRDVPEGQTVVPLVKIPKPEEGAWEPSLVWFEDRVERQWVAGTPPPAPTFTAAEWVDAQGFAGNRSTTMLYLKLKLDAAQAASPKATRRAGQSTKRTATNPAEALEILTSALEICRQSGIQIRMGKLTGKNMVGISLYPATVEINDGKHLIKPA
jgi:hypothetical protein